MSIYNSFTKSSANILYSLASTKFIMQGITAVSGSIVWSLTCDLCSPNTGPLGTGPPGKKKEKLNIFLFTFFLMKIFHSERRLFAASTKKHHLTTTTNTLGVICFPLTFFCTPAISLLLEDRSRYQIKLFQFWNTSIAHLILQV